MIRSGDVERAILRLSKQLSVLSLPEEADESLSLVVQQQRLLEAYIHSAPPAEIDRDLIFDIQTKTDVLMARAREAHADAAIKLDALALGRSAVSAYEGGLEDTDFVI